MEQKITTTSIALKYGVITAVAAIVYSAILLVTSLNTNQALGYLGFVILIAGMVLAMRDFRTSNAGYMSYGQGLGIGTMVSGIVGLLSSAFSVLYMKFIDPNVMQQAVDTARENLEKQGLDDSQIEAGMEMSQKFMTPGMMFMMGTLSYIIIGFIISLIVAAIMRRNEPIFE